MALDREKILQSAQKYVDRKKYDKAVEEYQKIVREDPKDARTLLKIGDLQARMQAYAEAIATYDRVGQQYAAQGFALKAVAVYKQVRELIRKHAPELADRYAHIVPKLAEVYTHLGLPNDALAAYDEVATHYQRTGREREASEVFRKMIELDPGNPLPHLRLAEAYCRVNELDSAIGGFWKASELLLGMGRKDDALKVIERILHFRQDHQYARAAAELYLQKGTREDGLQALAKLQICFQQDPKDLDTLSLLAQAFMAISADAKALEVYKEMARVARELGRNDLFEELLEHLLGVAPEDEQIRALGGAPAGSSSVPEPSSKPTGTVEETDLEIIEELSVAPSCGPTEIPVIEQVAPRPVMPSVPDVVVAEEDAAAAEAAAAELRESARRAAVDAESFRKLRLYSKAVEALRLALDLDPGSVEIRDKLRLVLEECGDLESAADETVALAEIYLAHQDHETAHALCQEALQLSPENLGAHQLLSQMVGVRLEVDAWQSESVLPPLETTSGSGDTASTPPVCELDSGATGASGREPLLAGMPLGAEGVDDPFGEFDAGRVQSYPVTQQEETTSRHEAMRDSLPSFDDAEDSPRVPEHDVGDRLDSSVDSAADLDARTAELYGGASALPNQLTAADVSQESPVEAVEEALEEAEFFATRGLYDDARSVLNDQLGRTPNHPLLLERLRELGQIPSESGTIERSQLAGREYRSIPGDHEYDIAASLGALDALPKPEEDRPARQAFSSVRDEVDVDEVFAKFKEGIRQQVPENDAATHYDLGVAYKEMGLLNDAVWEFEMAARDPDRECNCFAMIGLICLEQGRLEHAEGAYLRGLEAERKTVEQEMALYYDLGNVKEMRGLRDEALYYFKKIARRDPGFRDVKDRILALEPPPVGSAARAVAEDDEFDAVFDKLFESS